MNAAEMFTALRSAVEATGERVQLIGETIEPPAIVLTPPTLRMTTNEATPTEATYGVACAVSFDDRTVQNTIELMMKVLQALDDSNEEFVISGDIVPGTVPSNPGQLPAYLIDIETVLT